MALLDILTSGQPFNFSELLQTFFIPFIILFSIFWGLLSIMRIFSNKINIVLALGLTLGVAFTGVFTIFTTYLFQFSSFLAVGIFALVFIFGIIRWGFGRSRDIYYETGGYEAKIKRLQKRIAELRKNIDAEGDEYKKREMKRELFDLEHELSYTLDAQKRSLNP
jgi:hypothetical protein